MDNPLVSICCIVYNHEPFLRECFEGFVMQKTTFPIEVLVHDDASTDHSTDIIREYTAKYPEIFKPIYQTENQYSKGVDIISTYQFSRAQGKYIAMCEGDDYWTDPMKLQKQVDFLEENENYAICFHNVNVLSNDDNEKKIFSHLIEKKYSAREVYNKWTIPTCSCVFRSENLRYYTPSSKVIFGDIHLFLSILEKGDAYCFNNKCAVYRRTDNGLSSTKQLNPILTEKLFYQYRYMMKIFPEVKDISVRLRNKYLNMLIDNHNCPKEWIFRLYKCWYEPRLFFSRFCLKTFFYCLPKSILKIE